MGSGSSRMEGSFPHISSRPHIHHRHRRSSFRRTLSSLLICGASSSSRPRDEVEDYPPDLLVSSLEDSDLRKIHFLAKNSVLSAGTGPQYSNPITGTTVTSERSMLSSENSSTADPSGNSVAGNKWESLSHNVESSQIIFNEKPSPSYGDESSSEPATNDRAIADVVNNGDRITNEDVTLNCPALEQYPSSSDGVEESSDEVSIENLEREMLVFHECDSASASASGISDSEIDTTLQTSSSRFLVSEREQSHRDREGNAFQDDMASISANTSVASSELNNHEGRRNSRRLFWDAFSRRSSRRTADSRTFVFTADDADGLGSHERWLFDFSSDVFDEGTGGDSRRHRNSNLISNERRWHSSSEIWERFRDVGRNGSGHRTTTCPSGIHPDGTCACGSTLRAEESGARASISRIVMLAEALFEVLDEIHRQPMSVSLATGSLPAPESAVDSLPLKYYKKLESPESGDNVAQCYICLAEYADGDKIRVLPCHHEFHLSCVDKWLKDIHGVCPLCRGDVREGIREGSVSSSGDVCVSHET